MVHDRILIIDDNRAIHEDFRKILGSEPRPVGKSTAAFLGDLAAATQDTQQYNLTSAYQGEEGVELAKEAFAADKPFSVAFVDMRMPPGWDGLETIEKLWLADPRIQVVICSAYSDYSWSTIRERIGESDQLLILKKPFDSAEVSQLAVALTEKWARTRQAESLLEKRTRQLSQAEASLSVQNRHLQMATEIASLGYWTYEIDNQKLQLSERTAQMLDASMSSVQNLEDLVSCFHDPDHQRLSLLLDAAANKAEEFQHKSCVRTQNNDLRHIQMSVIHEQDAVNNKHSLFGVLQDITENERAITAIKHASLHDPLTDLPNRALLTERLGHALRHTKAGEYGTALVLLDIDHFKRVNDTLGHPIGDRLLVEFGKRLRDCAGELDTVGRLGGDEFAIVKLGVGAPEDMSKLIHRIFEQSKEPFELEGKTLMASVSAGVAWAPPNGLKESELMKAADLALYRAKQDGRGVYRFFDEEMDLRMQHRHKIENEIEQALELEQLHLFFQPIIDATTSRLTGVEALLRWSHPTLGNVPPDEFISIAEENGEIVPIGKWVLQTACKQAAKWPEPLTVAVNVSAIQLQHPDFLQTVKRVLAASGVTPRRLELEITETAFLEDTDETLSTLRQLQKLGVRIAMDDFGIGYSSLRYLRDFPFDKLKLDKSFVLDCDQEESRVIVSAVAALGVSLGIDTCAEGVETNEHFALIRSEGYTHAQGYLFGKPKPADEALPMLDETLFA